MIYEEREAENITDLVFSDLLNISKIDRLTQPESSIDPIQTKRLFDAKNRLLNHEPLQHILGQSYFYKSVFKINQHTLIPRPETEELVDLIKNENPSHGLKLLDIGTGSGCIAISLALALNQSTVHAADISEEALIIAKENARLNNCDVAFVCLDVLQNELPQFDFDIIVSNPPYIPEKEASEMNINVTAHEPKMALFVPDEDPLLFYRIISQKAIKKLNPGGKIYFEIHEKFGFETKELLASIGFQQVRVTKDMQGKDRIVSGIKQLVFK